MDFLKKLGIPLIALVFTFTLGMFATGCGGGGAAPGTNTISGKAAKGPFVTGSTVTAYQLNSAGVRSGKSETTTTTDDLGSYSMTVLWGGPTEIEVTGSYLDELSGGIKSDTIKAVESLPTPSGVQTETVNLNIVTTIAAELVQAKGVVTDAEITAANGLALSALGIDTTTDPTKLDLTDTTDPANAALLVISAALVDTVTNAGVTDVKTLLADFATDIKDGKKLGTTGAGTITTQIGTSIATVNTNISTIVTNLTSVGGTTSTGTLTTAVTDVTADVQTTLKGVALSGNTFSATTGNQVWTVATSGVASVNSGATAADATNVAITGTLVDYTGAANPKSTSATFSFYIASTGDSRKISGTLSPVTVAVDSAGEVTVSAPVGAVLTFSGTTSAGTTVSGTATNLGADTIVTTTSGVFTINASNLLTTITNKVGNADLNVLGTAGTFDFEFGFSGIEIGHEASSALDALFPATSAHVTGRAISGQIVTQ